ncbi:MAG: MFS transporter [Candidatus Wallbacteria bacterium]|nr:MFS transporter [Candidatus Wallbacteria bacterium]
MKIATLNAQNTVRKTFESLFGIKPAEFRLVQTFFIYFMLIGMYSTIGANAADILFLSRLGTEKVEGLLPWIYIGIAVNAILVTMAYDFVKERFSRIGLMVGLQLLLASAIGLLRVLVLMFPQAEWVYFSICVSIEACILLAFTLFFSLAGDYFTSRDARRLYGYITGGLALGFTIGGYLTEPLAGWIGTENLLIACSGILVSFALMVLYINKMFPPLENPEHEEDEEGAPISQLFKSPYLIMIFTVVILAGITQILVDYSFKVLASGTYNEEQMAAFFGSFWSWLGVVSLFVQFLVVGWVLRNWGVIKSLLILPLLLVISNYTMVFVPTLAVATVSAFVFFTLFEALNTPAQELLFLPLDSRMRHRAQSIADGALASLGLGLGGAGLLILNGFTRNVAYVGLAAAIVVTIQLVLTLMINPKYRQLLDKSLKNLAFKPADLEAFIDRMEGTTVLADMLKSGVEPVVLMTMDLLKKKPHPKYIPVLTELVSSQSETVAARAVKLLGTDQMPVIEKALSDPRLCVRTSALEVLCACMKEEAVGQVEKFVDDPLMRDAALFCFVKHCGFPGALIAYPRIDKMLKSEIETDRLSVAALLSRIEVHGTGSVVGRLLMDSSKIVRIEALNAAVISPDPQFLPLLVDQLSDFDARPTAIRAIDALSARGKSECIVSAAEVSLEYSTKAVLLRSLEYSPDDMKNVLWESFQHTDDIRIRIVAANVFKRLRLSGARTDFDPPGFEDEVVRFIDLAELVALAAMEGGPCAVLLRDHARLMTEMLLSLLCLKHDAALLNRVSGYLFGSNETLRANAGELLELILPKATAKRLVDLSMLELTACNTGLSKETENKLRTVDKWCGWVADYSECLRGNGGNMQSKELTRMMSNISILKQVGIFSDIPAEYLMTVASIAEEKTLFAGETLFKEGDAGDALYIICDGAVSVITGGSERAQLGPNDHLGEMALLDDQPRSATAKALHNSRLIRISSGDFRNLLGSHPRITMSLLSALAKRLRGTLQSG